MGEHARAPSDSIDAQISFDPASAGRTTSQCDPTLSLARFSAAATEVGDQRPGAGPRRSSTRLPPSPEIRPLQRRSYVNVWGPDHVEARPDSLSRQHFGRYKRISGAKSSVSMPASPRPAGINSGSSGCAAEAAAMLKACGARPDSHRPDTSSLAGKCTSAIGVDDRHLWGSRLFRAHFSDDGPHRIRVGQTCRSYVKRVFSRKLPNSPMLLNAP